MARTIGTEEFAKTMPEYCGVISKSPTVKAVKQRIEHEESLFDFTVLDSAVAAAQSIDIRDIVEQTRQDVVEVETAAEVGSNDIVLDIRSVDEQESQPLLMDNIVVQTLPFYKLGTQFGSLDQTKSYLLYCDRGVMSRLQALYLREQGFANVKVYRP